MVDEHNASTIAAIALAALGLGAGAMRLGQMALKRNGKKNGPAGEMSKDAWIVIFDELFNKHLGPFQERHERLIQRLERMAETFQANRQIIIDKSDKIIDLLTQRRR